MNIIGMFSDSPVRRILMTTDAVGGVWQYAIELAAGLAGRNVETVLVAFGPSPSAGQMRQAKAVPGLRLLNRNYKLEWMQDPWWDLSLAAEWLHELEEVCQPDAIHLNSFMHAALPWQAPVVVVAHSCVASWYRAVEGCAPPEDDWQLYCDAVERGLAAADCVVAPSQAMMNGLKEYGAHFREARVIPNARSSKQFYALDKQGFVLTAGRLWDKAKNVALLEKIAPKLDVGVYAAGPAAFAGGARERFENIHHLGALHAKAIAQWMSRAAVYAAPALYEPFGLTVLEAALSGCALVLSDIASFREIWGDAAVYADPHDEQEWIDRINSLVRDPVTMRARAMAARRRALAYSPERMTNAYLALYQDLCDRNSIVGHANRVTGAMP